MFPIQVEPREPDEKVLWHHYFLWSIRRQTKESYRQFVFFFFTITVMKKV